MDTRLAAFDRASRPDYCPVASDGPPMRPDRSHMIVIVLQTEDAQVADQVVRCADDTGNCRVVVIDNGVVTRGAPAPTNGGVRP